MTENVGRWVQDPNTRRWLYGIANAGLALAVVYGMLNETKQAGWLLLINAVLSMAQVNTPHREVQQAPPQPRDTLF